MILVLGTDPMQSSPILDLRIRKAIRRNGARLVVATERPTALDGGAEAIARYAPGQASYFLGALTAAVAGGAENIATPLAESLRDAGKVVVVWGERIGASAANELLGLADALASPSTEGAGLLEVPDTTNARGLREAGVLPDAGPGLRRCAINGHGTEAIREALIDGELDGVILVGVDPLRDFADTGALGGGPERRLLRRRLLHLRHRDRGQGRRPLPARDPRRERRHRHPPRRPPAASPPRRRPPRRHPPRLADPLPAFAGPGPRHRRHLPAHRLHSPDDGGPVLRLDHRQRHRRPRHPLAGDGKRFEASRAGRRRSELSAGRRY